MSDFLDTQIVKVVGQVVNGEQQVYVGVKTDNNVRTLLFTGVPFLGDAQVVSIYWTLEDGSLDDSTQLEKSADGYVWAIDNNLTQHGGKTVKGYLTVTSGLQTWNTKKFPIVIADLPKAADGSSSFTPTLYGQILETANTIEVLKLATDDNAEATARDRLAVEDALEQSNQNAQLTAQDRAVSEQAAAKTDADSKKTALDRAAVEEARTTVENNTLASDEDAQATAADRLAIAGVLSEAAALRDATKADKEAADADALATGQDRIAVGQDKATVAGHKTAAETAATKAEAEADEAERQAGIAQNNILNGVTVHDESPAAHQDVRDDILRVEAIARGRSTSYTFDTLEQLDSWLAGTYARVDGRVKADLIQGDNLWIRDVGVTDQWWDAEHDCRQDLEAEAPDLIEYYTKAQVDALLPIVMSRSEYDALPSPEPGRTYDIHED